MDSMFNTISYRIFALMASNLKIEHCHTAKIPKISPFYQIRLEAALSIFSTVRCSSTVYHWRQDCCQCIHFVNLSIHAVKKIHSDEKIGAKFWILPSCHRLLHKNLISYVSFSSTVYITITIWTTWNFRDCKILHVDGYFLLDIVNRSFCVFQRKTSLMLYTLIHDPKFQWLKYVFKGHHCYKTIFCYKVAFDL